MATEDENEATAIAAFVSQLHAHTVSLVRLEPSTSVPVFLSDAEGGHLLASGMIWNDADRLLLLCAAHTLQSGTWGLETTRIDYKKRRTLLLRLEPSFSGSLDFGWVDLKSVLMLVPDTKRPETLPVYRGPIHGRPNANDDYGFAAANRAELLLAYESADLVRDPSFEVGMRFEGSHTDGRYVFKLARAHRGHAYYHGASGAPIANGVGEIVSLVSGGDEAAHVIYGVPLADVVERLPK